MRIVEQPPVQLHHLLPQCTVLENVQFDDPAARERADHSRRELDAYAVESQRRAKQAWDEGRFDREVLTVIAPEATKEGELTGNKLTVDDFAGTTVSLTNPGGIGAQFGLPIINQPQVAILAVGAIKKRPVVIETEQGDTIGIRHMMYLSLSYDHRIVDGSIGASFLTAVAKEFENWSPDRQW